MRESHRKVGCRVVWGLIESMGIGTVSASAFITYEYRTNCVTINGSQ